MAQSAHKTGSITADKTDVTMNVSGFSHVGIQITIPSTFSGTVTFKGSIDGVNFADLSVATLADGTTFVTSATNVGVWVANIALQAVRAICTSYSSGTAVVNFIAA